MTYSRPGISRVNVSAGRGGGNTPTVRLPSGSTVSRNAPFRDNRSPAQAGENAKRKYDVINTLLEFATSEEVTKVVRDQIDNNAKREAGEALDAYPAIATTGTDDQEAIAAYNALSPRAQSFVGEARAVNAVSSYSPALQAEMAARPIIFAAGDTPEQQEARATAIAEAQAAARDVSGLSGLTPFQLTQNSEELARVDGAVKGAAYKARLANQTDLAQVGLIQGAATGLFKGWNNLSEVGADDRAGDRPLTAGWRATLQEVVTTSANNFGPKGQAMVLAGGISEALNRITDPLVRFQFLEQTLAETRTKMIGADGETDIFSIPLGQSGSSIKDILQGQLPGAETEADAAIIGRTYLQMEQMRQAGDAQGARDLGLSMIGMLNDPTKIPAFIQQIESLTTRVTPEMRKNGYRAFDRQLDGEDPTKLYKEMIAAPVGTYAPADISRMYTISRPDSDGNAAFARKNTAFTNSKSQNSDAFSVGFNEYLRYTGGNQDEIFKPNATGTGRSLTVEGQRQKANFQDDVRARFFELMDEAEPGKFDPNQALTQAINETVGKAQELAGSNAEVISTPQQQFKSWSAGSMATLGQVAAQNGGSISSDNIPEAAIQPSVMKAWQAANPGRSFDSLTGLQKEKLMADSIQTYKKYVKETGQYVNFTPEEARKMAAQMLEDAERGSLEQPVSGQPRIPEFVPETPEQERRQLQRPRMQGYGAESIHKTMDLLKKAAEWSTTPQKDPFNFNQIFNNNGFGDQAMAYVDSFLNIVVGAPPAYAGELSYGTPEGLTALRQSWSSGQQGLNTPPMPQVPWNTPVRYIPTAITSDKHEFFVLIGVAEGTRYANGGYTDAYFGHRDIGDNHNNRGTVSGGRNSDASPRMVDAKWMGTLTNVMQRMRGPLIVHGLMPGTQGYNRMMFNLIDLTVQSPAAARDFAGKLIQMKNANWTVEAIAKARADSYINPQTGRLEAAGFGNSYQRLFKDQRSRAGVYDYRRRI